MNSNDKQREAFEAWARREGWSDHALQRHPQLGDYADVRLEGRWVVWQAALAQRPEPPTEREPVYASNADLDKLTTHGSAKVEMFFWPVRFPERYTKLYRGTSLSEHPRPVAEFTQADIDEGYGAFVNGRMGRKKQMEALRAAIEAANQSWQPIESAPRDGTLLLLWNVGKHSGTGWPVVGSAQSDHPVPDGRGWNDCSVRPLTPTHWMPLPPPPDTTHGRDEDRSGGRTLPLSDHETEPVAWGWMVDGVLVNTTKVRDAMEEWVRQGRTIVPLYASPVREPTKVSPEVEEPECLLFADQFPNVTHDMDYFERHIKALAAEVRRLRAVVEQPAPQQLSEQRQNALDAWRYRKLRDVEFDQMTWTALRTCSESAFPTLIDDYRDAAPSPPGAES